MPKKVVVEEVVNKVTGEVVKRTRVVSVFKKPSRTQQVPPGEYDVNEIVGKYNRQAVNKWMRSPVNPEGGVYLDLIDAPSYQQAWDASIKADAAFAALPSEHRLRFDNDPRKFLEFVHDKKNRDELIKMGLVEKPKGPSDADRIIDAVSKMAPKEPKTP